MKSKYILLFALIYFSHFIGLPVKAQKNEPISPFRITTDIVSNYNGVYLSANDYTNGKVSYANNQNNKKYKFYLHEIYHTSSLKIISGDSVVKLNKYSVFGYCDKHDANFCFVNKAAIKS